jgi:hypothetical protein
MPPGSDSTVEDRLNELLDRLEALERRIEAIEAKQSSS